MVRGLGRLDLATGLLGAVVLVVALLIGAYHARFAEVAVPGSVDVWLAPGAYTVVHEYPGNRVPREVHCTLTDVETGQVVLVQPPAMAETVTVLNRPTDILYGVEIERAGVDRLAVQYAPDAAPADVVFALGCGPGDRFRRLLATVGLGVAGGALWVRRGGAPQPLLPPAPALTGAASSQARAIAGRSRAGPVRTAQSGSDRRKARP